MAKFVDLKPTVKYLKFIPSTLADKEHNYNRLAMFDLDGTLIKTKSGYKFPQNSHDWSYLYPEIPDKLRKLANKYNIIIITNQAGFMNRKFILDEIIEVVKDLNLPIEVYVSTDKDVYRKPNTTIFEEFIMPKISKQDLEIYYIGDAAGREDDFADSDRKFAYNLFLLLKLRNYPHQVGFKTPEEFFLSIENQEKKWQGFDPKKYLDTIKSNVNTLDLPNEQHIIIMIGFPASGKSTLSEEISDDKYAIVNQDICKTKQKCVKLFEEAIKDKKSVILDRTNLTSTERGEYIKLALEINPKIKIIGILLSVNNKDLYEHLNIVRERMLGKRIPEIVYRTHRKKYEEPKINEKFDKIIKLEFIPKFTDKNHLLYFLQRS